MKEPHLVPFTVPENTLVDKKLIPVDSIFTPLSQEIKTDLKITPSFAALIKSIPLSCTIALYGSHDSETSFPKFGKPPDQSFEL